jgi:putative transposase
MPRQARNAPGGLIYHVLNRANGRLRLFKKEEDFLAFERVLKHAHKQVPIRILSWCIMSNHWHFVLWPTDDGELTAFMRKLTHTHAQRWKVAHNAVGHGHLYQGRFKSFPVQEDEHLLTLLRYVESNPLRAGILRRAQDWRWGSYSIRSKPRDDLRGLLSPWPIDVPADWSRWIHEPQTAADEELFKTHIVRGRPMGDIQWTMETAQRLGLEHALRSPGRQVGWRKSTKGKRASKGNNRSRPV